MTPRRSVSIVLSGLVGATLVSGILLAYVRHEHRAQFRAMQTLIAERDELEVEWGALQLERAAWAGYRRIDLEARQGLAMRQPEKRDIVFLRVNAPNASIRESRTESR